MNKPQVLDHTDDFDQRISALESDMDAIKSNHESLIGTMQESFARVSEDVREIRDMIAKVIAHTNERFKSMDNKIQSLNDKMEDRIQSLDDKIQSTRDDLQKSFRDDLRDFRREIKEDIKEFKEDVKEDVKDSVNGLRWTIGIIVALAVAVMKLLP